MPDVYVFQGGEPARMAYEAAERIFDEDASALSVLLKVNTGFKGPAASGLCTHPEVVRGLIRFFKDRHVKTLYVGDSSIVGTDSLEALKAAGIWSVCQEVTLILRALPPLMLHICRCLSGSFLFNDCRKPSMLPHTIPSKRNPLLHRLLNTLDGYNPLERMSSVFVSGLYISFSSCPFRDVAI